MNLQIMFWSHYFVTLLLLISSASSSPYIPSLSLPHDSLLGSQPNELASNEDDFKVFFYNQTLDHFNYRPESYATFPQKYVINSKYWGGPNSSAPIFAFLGAESPIDGTWTYVGFLNENSPRLKALELYIEVKYIWSWWRLFLIWYIQTLNYLILLCLQHRFYGESDPSKSIEDDDISGYFNSAQALADYAEVILHIKKKLHAQNSPVIVLGGSYGGSKSSYLLIILGHLQDKLIHMFFLGCS